MQHAEAYKFIVSLNGKAAILLRPQKGNPLKPYILYDGSDHAFLYRNSQDVLLLDYLNTQIIPVLQNADSIVIIEADWQTNETINDYLVPIKHQAYV